MCSVHGSTCPRVYKHMAITVVGRHPRVRHRHCVPLLIYVTRASAWRRETNERQTMILELTYLGTAQHHYRTRVTSACRCIPMAFS